MDIVIPMNSESTRVPYVPPSGSAPVATKPAKRKSGSLKTVLTVLLGLAAIVVLALPYAHGALAKRVSSELLKASNENNQFSKIELVNYSGGYASSQATYKLILSADVAKISSGEYTFNCNTKHKITGYRQNCRLGNAGYLEWLEENLKGKDPFTTTLKGSLFGKFGTELEVTPFEVKSEDGEIMSMGAAKIVTDVKAITGSAMRFQGQADGLTFKDSETDIVLGGATLEGDLESDGVLAFGFGNVLIDSFKMSDAEENVVMKKVSFVYELPLTEGKLNMEYDLRVESADFNDLVSGDTMKVSNASYATEAGGLDAKVVSELSKKYQIAIKEIDNGSLTDEEVSSAVFDQVFMPEIERLLIAGAFMKLNIMATVDDKPFEGEFAVTLDQDITQEDLSSGAVAPDVVLQKVDLAFKLSLSELFLADMEKISGYPAGSMAANSPYMVKNGDNFELIATAKKGVITLNGEESSLAEIIGKSMGMAAGSPASGMEDLSPEEQQELMQLLQQMKSE